MLGDIVEAQAGGWHNRIGLELYTVRDQLATNFEGVLAKVAAIGYKEIEPANHDLQDRSRLARTSIREPWRRRAQQVRVPLKSRCT
jgi:hypothetical protein